MNQREALNFLNGLDEERQNALQIAALLGDTFSLDHIVDISNIRPSKLLNLLNEMVEKDLIREKPKSEKGVYVFSKKKFHTIILEAMGEEKTDLYLSNIVSYLERYLPNDHIKSLILANLFLKFKNKGDRYQHMKKAADFMASAHKTEEALDLYKKIIDGSLSKDRDSLDSVLFIESVLSYAPIAINRCPFKEILPVVDSAINLADTLQNNRAKAMLKICLGRLFQCQGDSVKASSYYNEGWNLAQRMKDTTLLKTGSKLFALSLFWQGRIKQALQMYEETIGNLEDISPELRDLWAYLMLAYCYGITGRVARGVGMAEAIRERALSKGYNKTQAFAHAVIAQILLEVRQLANAEPHISKALKIGERVGSDLALWMVKPCKAYELYSKGNLKGARDVLESAISHAKKLGQIHYPSPWILEILWYLHRFKWKAIEGYSFPSEIDRLLNWPDIYMKGAALRYHALSLKTSEGDVNEIRKLLEQSQALLSEAGALVELGRTQIELARLHIENKEQRQAKDLANLAYKTFSEIDTSLFPSELLSLIKEKTRGSRLYHGVSDLSGALNSLPDYEVYLGKVVTILTDMFGAERAAIILISEEGPDYGLNMAATRNFNPEELKQFPIPTLRKLMVKTIKAKEPLIVADLRKNSEILQTAITDFPIRSLALIPLLAQSRVFGLIYMDNRLLNQIFSQQDLIILTAIGSQISLALKTAGLLREVKNNINDSTYDEESLSLDQREQRIIFPQMIAKSEAMKNVLSKVQKVSKTDATVLILGETGVGKELIAQLIHQLSHRQDKPFITVNVSALTENLLTSELFGHEKGAFTGAASSKVGRFEMADGGTIFLDEIGDLSIEAQVKLLRVLQEGEFERVGGTQTLHSDFRLIAATNRDLRDMVARGEFRSDLFYRISIFPIEIPPLRERDKDIPLLALHFMKKYAGINRKNLKRISDHEMKKLKEYAWPGNVRELEHVIEKAVILSESETVTIPDFEQHHTGFSPDHLVQPELLPLDEIQRRHIINVLEHVKWRIRGDRGAAKILGLKPSTLEFRMKKLRIKK